VNDGGLRQAIIDYLQCSPRADAKKADRELLAGVDLSGTLDQLEIRGVYPVRDGLEFQVVFGGALRLVGR
jgi:hypothetical protein